MRLTFGKRQKGWWSRDEASFTYRVRKEGCEGDLNAADFRYSIWLGTELVAYVLHDFWVDEHWFELDGVAHDVRSRRHLPIMLGHCGQTLQLTRSGEERLERILSAKK